ncbi:hypothetical protein BIFCAT_01087 [Bifidobacterium catenulatum DSM 16992 = JCM 1194 = LMG 11043]|uniref:Uncharacterized protein n=1 Tax=Bifidobacterium catenulatum DSM 16992 = JCM 1194 = LMG 11043 TaxID=566552 RepID=B6XUA4_9BIFI|nr:hypothetical protein BIFCAT_01087 [Bifidobacterium catenulatum DSM 16992 = JCM 1194 = LMG 11043]
MHHALRGFPIRTSHRRMIVSVASSGLHQADLVPQTAISA